MTVTQNHDLTIERALKTGTRIWDRDRQAASISDDRHLYLNASELDTCIRRQFYAKQAAKARVKKGEPALTEASAPGMARRGHLIEDYVIEALKAANVPVIYCGDDQRSFRDEEHMLSATPDGVVVWDEEDAELIEIKSYDPRSNTSRFPRPHHVAQVQLGIEMVARQTAIGVTRGTLIYVNASDLDERITFKVDRDPKVYERAKRRAKTVLKSRSPAHLPREGQASHECRYCPFSAVCLGDKVAQVQAAATAPQAVTRGNKGSVLATSVIAYTDAQQQAAEAKEVMDREKDVILREMTARKATDLKVGDHRVKIMDVKGRTTLDRLALAADGVELSKYEKTGAPSTRLVVE